MARNRYSDEDVLKLLREIEVHLASGSDVPTACREAPTMARNLLPNLCRAGSGGSVSTACSASTTFARRTGLPKQCSTR